MSASLIKATYCAQDSDFHAASVLALVAGLIMAADGIVRRIVSARTARRVPVRTGRACRTVAGADCRLAAASAGSAATPPVASPLSAA